MGSKKVMSSLFLCLFLIVNIGVIDFLSSFLHSGQNWDFSQDLIFHCTFLNACALCKKVQLISPIINDYL